MKQIVAHLFFIFLSFSTWRDINVYYFNLGEKRKKICYSEIIVNLMRNIRRNQTNLYLTFALKSFSNNLRTRNRDRALNDISIDRVSRRPETESTNQRRKFAARLPYLFAESGSRGESIVKTKRVAGYK